MPTPRPPRIRAELKVLSGVEVAVLITDTFGRPWRDGLTEVCLGIAGHRPDARSARLAPIWLAASFITP